MTEKVRTQFDKYIEQNINLNITVENIEHVIQDLMLHKNKILQEGVVEIFDLMTKYDEHNRVHVEGWKTNDAWKVNKKVIIPYGAELDYSGIPTIRYSRVQNFNDIDRAIGFLSGKKLSDIGTIVQSYKYKYDLVKNGNIDSDELKNIESEFFNIKCYKKGTIHITFKDLKLLEKFNMSVAKVRNWIPDNYKDR